MTNVRRPIHLQLRPAGHASPTLGAQSPGTLIGANTPTGISHKPLSPTGDSLPSQILPHLFVGNQEQTNRETLNRLNISYILSLGLLPLISATASPTSPGGHNGPQHQHGRPNQNVSMPSQNSSRDFRIRLRTGQSGGWAIASTPNGSTPSGAPLGATATTISGHQTLAEQLAATTASKPTTTADRDDENKAIRVVRSIQCKCINIADNSEQSLVKFFDEALQFIDEARRKKCNILVHCLAGISRSPTIAIAYLMQVNSLRLQDAYNYVKQCRPQIEPNLNFVGQLMKYERCLEERVRMRPLQTTPLSAGSPIRGQQEQEQITSATNPEDLNKQRLLTKHLTASSPRG